MKKLEIASILISIIALSFTAWGFYYQFIQKENKLDVWLGNFEGQGKGVEFSLVFMNNGNSYQNISEASISTRLADSGLGTLSKIKEFPIILRDGEMKQINIKHESDFEKYEATITFKVIDITGKEHITSYPFFNYEQSPNKDSHFTKYKGQGGVINLLEKESKTKTALIKNPIKYETSVR